MRRSSRPILAVALSVVLVSLTGGCVLGDDSDSTEQKLSDRLVETTWASALTEISGSGKVGTAFSVEFDADGTAVIWDTDRHTADWKLVSEGEGQFGIELTDVERTACPRDCERAKPSGVGLVRQSASEITALEIEYPEGEEGSSGGASEVFPADRSDISFDQLKGKWLGSFRPPGALGEVYVKLRLQHPKDGTYSYGPSSTAGTTVYSDSPSLTVHHDGKDYWVLVPTAEKGAEGGSTPLAGEIAWGGSPGDSTVFAPYTKEDGTRFDRLGTVELSYQP